MKTKEELRKYSRELYHKHRDVKLLRRKELTEIRKQMVFILYGERCQYCGFSDKRALQLDHVQNDGAVERRRNGKNVSTIWRDAAKHFNPDKYQILCSNCNWIKHISKGGFK